MKTRIISGAVALLLLVIIILLRETVLFNIGFGLIAALMVYELFKAEKLEKEYVLAAISALFALLSPLIPYFVPFPEEGGLSGYEALSRLAVPYIAAAFAYIVIATALLLVRHSKIPAGGFYTCASYTVLISVCMCSLCGIVKIFGKESVVYLAFAFMGAWIADSGAYFAGTFFGKHKLCPTISPKKTVEGLVGGILTNALAFALLAFFANKGLVSARLGVIAFAIIGCVCALLGLLGDLTASLIKRECGIKDFGNIMPGHGGAMDRFDSVVYIAPFMLFMLTIGAKAVMAV